MIGRCGERRGRRLDGRVDAGAASSAISWKGTSVQTGLSKTNGTAAAQEGLGLSREIERYEDYNAEVLATLPAIRPGGDA